MPTSATPPVSARAKEPGSGATFEPEFETRMLVLIAPSKSMLLLKLAMSVRLTFRLEFSDGKSRKLLLSVEKVVRTRRVFVFENDSCRTDL